MITYVTKEGDVLDEICYKVYGKEVPGQVEKVLSLNQNLAEYGLILPSRLLIKLPELVDEAAPTVKLW